MLIRKSWKKVNNDSNYTPLDRIRRALFGSVFESKIGLILIDLRSINGFGAKSIIDDSDNDDGENLTARAVCDKRGSRDAICANCLLEFHVDCAAKLNDDDDGGGGGGKIVASNGTSSKNAYFLCFSCYTE
uniref:Zinc finger PHD-type domain-containing protein n=1 Tax=Romanomermis culicivorax TaxID=13658 RepID=A0A915KMN6_ROMCU